MKRLFIILIAVFLAVNFLALLNLLGKVPSLSFINKGADTKTKQQTVLIERLLIKSDVPGFGVSFSDKRFLQEKLNELHFWDANAVTLYGADGKDSKISVNSLQLILTDKMQYFDKQASRTNTNKTEIYQAFGMDYDKLTGQLKIILYFSPSLYKEEDILKLEKRISGYILSSLYTSVYVNLHNQDGKEYLTKKLDFIEPMLQLKDGTFVKVNR